MAKEFRSMRPARNLGLLSARENPMKTIVLFASLLTFVGSTAAQNESSIFGTLS